VRTAFGPSFEDAAAGRGVLVVLIFAFHLTANPDGFLPSVAIVSLGTRGIAPETSGAPNEALCIVEADSGPALDRIAGFRRRGLNVGAAEHFHHLADGALGGAYLDALEIGRDQNFLLAVQRTGIMDEREAEMGVLHLGRRIFVVPLVQRQRAFLAVGEYEGKLAGGGDRETPGLIAGIDVGDVGDAVACQVVVIERLAELLGGEDHRGDAAVRIRLDRIGPVLDAGLQRVRGRYPMRELELNRFVVGLGAASQRCQPGQRDQKRACRYPKHFLFPPDSRGKLKQPDPVQAAPGGRILFRRSRTSQGTARNAP